jgi:hypothetical protein
MQIARTYRHRSAAQGDTPPPPKPPSPPSPPKEEDFTLDTVIMTGVGGGLGYFMGSRFAMAMAPPMTNILGVMGMIGGAATAYVLAVDMNSPVV